MGEEGYLERGRCTGGSVDVGEEFSVCVVQEEGVGEGGGHTEASLSGMP